MNTTVFITFWLIVLARITDVTLDTIRTVAIVQGRRIFAATLGFFEAVVYISAIAKVLLNMNHPVYALAYGIGYASGTFLGITIEQHLAFGQQVASLFTRRALEMAKALAAAGYRLVEVKGHTAQGDLTILHVYVARRETHKLVHDATAIDDSCFCIVNDVRSAGFISPRKALIAPALIKG